MLPSTETHSDQHMCHTAKLNACQRSIWVDFSWNQAEDGSISAPFNTLDEGLANVNSGGTIKIFAGSTPEIRDIVSPVRLEAVDGPVLIGSQ